MPLYRTSCNYASMRVSLYENSIDTSMNTVTVSPKYQVVIPKDVRKSLKITPGTQLVVMEYDHHLVLVPLRPIQEYKGFLKGIDTTIERDEEDRV